MNYTIHCDPRINSKIEADLWKITDWLAEKQVSYEALVLVGGFGRGEGGVLIENEAVRVLNDYDILVVTAKPIPSQDLVAWGKTLADILGIRFLDLICYPKASLVKLPYTMFNYDLKYGGHIFKGDREVLNLIPEMDPGKMPLIEAKRLLLNRSITLLEVFDRRPFFGIPLGDIQLAKVIFACVDAVLVLYGEYHHSYLKKVQNFKKIVNETSFIELADRAAEFRLMPKEGVFAKVLNLEQKVTKIFFDVFTKVESAILKRNYDFERIIHKEFKGYSINFKRMINRFLIREKIYNDRMALNKIVFYLGFYYDRWNPGVQQEVSKEIRTLTKRSLGDPNIKDWNSVREAVLEYWYTYIH